MVPPLPLLFAVTARGWAPADEVDPEDGTEDADAEVDFCGRWGGRAEGPNAKSALNPLLLILPLLLLSESREKNVGLRLEGVSLLLGELDAIARAIAEGLMGPKEGERQFLLARAKLPGVRGGLLPPDEALRRGEGGGNNKAVRPVSPVSAELPVRPERPEDTSGDES